ncbi:dihydroxyacetone kinase phosphoryl donor subunit DhaM [Kitasatospora cineracea]|uniref:dihydroxyacetone kinase phosphoryl donor subunit DhaM n=1 Tax=Kitasatospora TaxID=2063 RepID=UPI0022843940|nr:dihydroxyacetone kinase phosphoryl donor subunit DhaM [Kitasatospora sp. YST-16]WAL75870.1 dihydroxyacetone kinase phosphoryl donor subunit DhaM [Kitasatospora sp. YST-16]WNW41931.1 dihydroxyacetone kinase phosphoryl donor subunit DhaM [Streptomyces sp. Li-HN-5-13]
MRAPVGLVLVSHSPHLARGVQELLAELADDVPVLLAAGTEDGSLGTSYDLTARAVRAADRGTGVLLLADLGSSVLTATLVLADLALPATALADAPFVEGAVAAAVTAATGAPFPEVLAAAEGARDFRKRQ